ncbi:hypothetical protein Glove_88g2 [Diversispora epigaea]|uniref:Protein kinase domain-containing protein n=1 Tax=Diversispora epigaea TaxID=1348612 RepID=A0A397JA79_9GLOM|nr:hypothetical protein Glove_88g2 [Diversispora epigaea]
MSSDEICLECNQEWNEYFKWCKPLIEWIPYDRFKDVKQIGKGGFGTIYYAKWIDGEIEKWDIENQQWKRYNEDKKVALKKFDNFVNFNDVLNEMEIHLKTYTKHNASIKFHGITQDPETYMMVLDYAIDGNLREYLKINFNNINWKQKLCKGGFGTIYYAKWIDGEIEKWDIENQQWKRYNEDKKVALKKFDNFVNFNDVLNEMEIHLKTYTKHNASIKFHGITQDPETYMMVLDYAIDGNLREYLKINFNNINWKQKLCNLQELSYKLMNVHKLDIVHQDFHPGNILSYNFKNGIYISDFGLSKLIGENPNNPEKKNIVGVLPYIAPEVLSGEEYTKAADVYSFGIIVHEMVTGFPPYPDIPHDKDLAIKICNGLRPKIPFHIPKLITRTIMRCWDARVTHRPTFKELRNELWKYYLDYYNKDSEIVIQIKKAEEFSANQESTNTSTTTPLNYQTHPQAVYTSRLLNYSNLPKPKNEENFEKELEELTESMSNLCPSDSGQVNLNMSNF